MTILINVLLSIYVVVSLLMLLVILMQRPKSEGLGAAFGGGVTENIFGAQTTNVLTKATAWLAGIFFVLTFVLSILYAHQSMSRSNLRRELMKTEAAKPSVPPAKPAPSSAIGAPGTVTNPTPGLASPTAASPNAAEAAVGAVPAATATASPNASPASPSPAPSP